MVTTEAHTVNTHLSWMDGVSIGSVVAALSGVLPTVLTLLATTLAIIWYALMISDWMWARRDRRAALVAVQAVTKYPHKHEDNSDG